LSATGRFNTGAGPIVNHFRSIGLNAAEEIVVGAGPITQFSQGIPRNANGEVVVLEAAQATQFGSGATPFGPNGEVEVSSGAVPIAEYHQGVPYTAGGVYASNIVGGPVIIAKDFQVTPAQFSISSAGYRGSPLAGVLAPDATFAGGTIDLVATTDEDVFSIKTVANAQFPSGSGNLAVQFGPYIGPGRLILSWDIDRYSITQPGINAYMVQQIGIATPLRLSIAPSGTSF
jgi:hypothetical protein